MNPGPLMRACWAALGGRASALDRLEVLGAGPWLGGPLAVDELAVAAVSAALLAAADLAEARGLPHPQVSVAAEHVALSFQSERHLLLAGRAAGPGFAPLSRFVRCSGEGWGRTHGNYPHHAAALGRALGFDPTGDPSGAVRALQDAAGRLSAEELEERVFAAGGCAAARRTPGEWAAHPAGEAAMADALVDWDETLATSAATVLGPLVDASRPATGVRVLDLTRVIAGPVAGRTLAALGADVLRVDPPHLPELAAQHLDTGAGKRSALLDLADGERREALLAGADVLLAGYHPGALARFGLDPDELSARHPHLVQVSLSAWSVNGPWASRRGFDSLVQVASGIAQACAAEDGTPGALPAQALDHATGHLIAAGVLAALARRSRGETHAPARLSLARTAAALLGAAPPAEARTEVTGRADPLGKRVVFADHALVAPPGSLDGVPLRWSHGPRPFGGDPPVWE